MKKWMIGTLRWWIVVCFVFLLCCQEKIIAEESITSKIKEEKEEAAREKLLTLLSGEWVSRGLYVATKLEIAEHLEPGPKSIEALAKLSSTHADALYRLLHMLAGFAIFEEVSPGVFANTDASLLLSKTNPGTLHSLSLFYGEEIHKSWEGLFSSIQTGAPAFQTTFGQPVFSYFKDNPERAELFQGAMKEKSRAVIKSALLTYNFGQFTSICDVGGGYGQFMQALLQTYPKLSGTLFDLPEVVNKVKQHNPQLENNRCQLCPGDFFVSIPEGKDAYLLKSVIHDWDDAGAEKILKNCYQAMGADSRLLIIEVVLQPGSQSVYANCMDVLMLAITGGKERSLASFNQMLGNCGFVIEHVYPTGTEFSILEARKK